mmetsp:Transcript_26421/g.56148  ORF Transcript_26421/g.56148 Transcript_26421/m.56148 type:complete len:173 (+) Transcript_26421:172-690(+)
MLIMNPDRLLSSFSIRALSPQPIPRIPALYDPTVMLNDSNSITPTWMRGAGSSFSTVADFQRRDIDNIATTKFADEAQAPEASGVKPPQSVSLSNISDSNSPKEATVEATPTNDKPNNPRVQPMDARPSPTQSYTLSQRTTPVTNFANPAAMKKKSSSFIVRGIKSKLGKKK